MSSPCVGSLALSGQPIGGAFSLTDAASQARIIGLPTGAKFAFSYSFEPTAPDAPGTLDAER
jgi:hypothetical protein